MMLAYPETRWKVSGLPTRYVFDWKLLSAFSRAAAVVLMLFMGTSIAAAEADLIQESTLLDVEINGKAVKLEAFIVREAGTGAPLPIAIFTHGETPKTEVRARMKASNFRVLARDLARRGWLAVVVLRRGYGTSKVTGAPYKRPRCRNRDYGPSIEAHTDDLEAALKAIARRPDADSTRIVAMGLSAGGMAALNLGTRDVSGLKAVVNFSGGILTTVQGGRKPGPKTCRKADLVKWLSKLGNRQKVPTLWLYAENDKLFSPEFVRQMHAAYSQAGGDAELHQFSSVGKDGHYLLTHVDGVMQWLPAADEFFRKHALSTFDVAPMEAALAKFSLKERERAVAKRYYGRHSEKVLAISPSGSRVVAQFGANSLKEAEAKALDICKDKAGEECRILWRNFEVVSPEQP
jgi:dienelactone hydrolase